MQRKAIIKQEVQSLIDANKPEEAITRIIDYLCSIEHSQIPVDKLLDIVCDIYGKTRDFENVSKAYAKILEFDSIKNSPWLKARAYDGFAKIAYFNGKYQLSLHYLKLAMKLIPENKFRYYYLSNLGRLSIKLGSFLEAIKNLYAARLMVPERSKVLTTSRIDMSLAYAYGLNGDILKGLEVISNVRPSDISESKLDESAYYEYKGHLQFMLARESGDKELCQEAIETLNQGLKIAYDFAPNGSGVGQTRRILAEIYLYLEDYMLSRENAVESFRISSCINERYELGVLYWIFAQIAEHDNDPKRAEFNLQMSRKILTDIGAAYEMKRLHSCELAPQVL